MTYGLVIASYKYGHLAAHAIETALDQTKPFDKIWFVDDGVGDCTHLPEIYPEVEYVLRTKNLGIVDNFQDMLNRVDTDYVMFLGADNWLRSDTLEKLSEYGTDIVMYDILVVGDRRKEIYHRHPGECLPRDGGIYWNRSGGHHGSMLYKADFARRVGGYESRRTGRTLEDMALWNKLRGAGATVSHIPEAFLYYRRHRENHNPC